MMQISVQYHQSTLVSNVAVEITIKRHDFFSEKAAEDFARAVKQLLKDLNAKDGQ